MTFYLILPGQTGDTITDHNVLGEISFKSFHVGYAWNVLKKLIENDSTEALKLLVIKDSSNKIWPIDNFLSEISELHHITY